MIKRVYTKITANFYWGQWHVTASRKLGNGSRFAALGIHRSKDVAVRVAKDLLRRYLEYYGREGRKVK